MMKKAIIISLITLTTITNLHAQTWTQIGQDIDGEAEGDYFGWSVSLSNDGSVIAAGAPYNAGNGISSGHVRVYENQSGIWNQIGTDIEGEAAGDEFGKALSLNANGSIVAIGAYFNDGNGIDAGHVRIYENISGTWLQIGSDIDGEAANDNFGKAISLNANGSVVAVGAPQNDGNGSNAGHVRIYRNISDTWTQIGSDIDGEASSDNSGYSISLSADGMIVAIGAPFNAGNGGQAGHVRIYENIADTWTQIGDDIDAEAAGDQSGSSVCLSSDGNFVAIGAPNNVDMGTMGHVRVYENISGVWTQVGQDLDGESSEDQFGYSVSLSDDGSILTVGAPGADGGSLHAGEVKVYNNNFGTWEQIGEDINGEEGGDMIGEAVSINADGSFVAVGSSLNDGNGFHSGHVRIFELLSLPIITVQPANQTDICPGTDVVFTLTAENAETYQWQVSTDNGNSWSDLSDNEIYSGSTTYSMTVSTDISLDYYFYACVVSNTDGDVTSDQVYLSFETEMPTITCLTNQEVTADATHSYTISGTEFDPVDVADNCEIYTLENGINNESTLDGVILPEGTTTIIWTVTDMMGFQNSCDFEVLVSEYVGIEDVKNKTIEIYPNPTNGDLNIKLADNKFQKLTISDITGNLLIEKSTLNQNETIDLSGFKSGLYIISIQTDKEMIINKIVKR